MGMTEMLQPVEVPAERHNLALQGFFQIMAGWKADDSFARRILGNPAAQTFDDWKKDKVSRVSADTLRRIGYVVGIWNALQFVFSNSAQAAVSWICQPNVFLGGQTPLEKMASGDMRDLIAVKAYLDAFGKAP